MQTCKGSLTKAQFDLLTSALYGTLEDSALGTNEVFKELAASGAIDGTAVTEAGRLALEPYRVKRAVIMAAGFGSRLVPITLNTPKPLVRVHGKRIIETVLDAIVAAGIEEIVIIRGYLGEQFDQLTYRYPNLTFIDNPLYNEANNISSMLFARELLENAYVLEADLLLKNPALIRPYEYSSNFLGIPVDSSDDWCFTVKNGLITSQVSNGKDCALKEGEALYQEVGISYWSENDGKKLARHIHEVFESPEGKNRYWDQVVFVDHAGEYDVAIRPCDFSDIVEIDSYRELVAIDGRYAVS